MEYMWLKYFTHDDSSPFYIAYGGHNDQMFMHGHGDFCELVIVLDGSAEHVVEQERFPVRKGDVFVMGKNIAHGYDNVNNFRICNIMFRPEALLDGDYDIKQHRGFHALFLLDAQLNTAQSFKSRLHLSPAAYSELKALLDAAVAEYSEANPGKQTILHAYFMQIVTKLSRIYDAPAKQREIIGIAEAAAYMENHYMDDITIEQVLDISHYSQRHFIRLFSSAYNTTPQKYLMNIRLRRACTLLRDSSTPITEIALKCGFGDSNYFSRAFRKAKGITPSQYRSGS